MKNTLRRLSLFAFLLFALSGCFVMDDPFTGLPPGVWRGVLKFEPSYITPNPKGKPLPEKLDMKYEDVTQGELPFLFTVTYPSADSFYITVQLGSRQLILSDIIFGRDFATAKDTLLVRLPGADGYLRGLYEEKIWEGEWVFTDTTGNAQSIPFTTRQGQDYLFTALRKAPAENFSGVWNLSLGMESGNPESGQLELIHTGNQLEAILEWRNRRFEYLSGTVQGEKLYLSFFDGRDAILMEGKRQEDGTLIGGISTATERKTLWQASKNQRN